MGKKPDLPEGWAMPDDLARRVHDQLTKNRVTPEVEVQNALDEIARDIAIIEPNPVDWAGWIEYLLEQMEGEAWRRRKRGDYEEMLRTFSNDLIKRQEN